MRELFVFCNPQNAYKRMSRSEISDKIDRLTIEYDRLLSFRDDYLEHSETSDYESIVNQKENMALFITIFHNQPVTAIGDIRDFFTSSSYIFNPREREDSELLLPDLDVVWLKANIFSDQGAKEISRFYESHGWRTHVFDGSVSKIMLPCYSEREDDEIEVFDPKELRIIASQKVGYDLERLCF